MGPSAEFLFHGCDYAVEGWKILVMETKLTRQFPKAFDRIQVGTIGREVVQAEVGCLGLSPGLVHFRMVKPGIVRDDDDASASLSAPPLKELQEVPEALPIKSIRFSLINEPPVTQAHRPKISDALARGVVQEDRVSILRGHPHPTPGAVLLKMHLIQCPEVCVRQGVHCLEFFYAHPVGSHPHAQSRVGASPSETPTGERTGDIVALPGLRRRPA